MDKHERTDFFVTGGTLRADAPCYVERAADRQLLNYLLDGEFCYVLTSRQMGKSSLMVRAAQKLREQGAHLAVLDLAGIGQNLTTEQWYDGLVLRIGRQLMLEDEMEDFWVSNARLGPCQRLFTALREVALPKLARRTPSTATNPARPPAPPGHLVIFVDELDVVRSLPFPTDEFFVAIRECYNRRTEDHGLNRLTFCLLGVATPSELIKDPHTTPFNIGHRIELTDFTLNEASELVRGLKQEHLTALRPEALLGRVHHWTRGHPYLTQRLFLEISSQQENCTATSEDQCIDQLCDNLYLSSRARETDDNLLFVRERILRTDLDLSSLLDLYEKVLEGQPVHDNELDAAVNQLRLAGIVRTEHNHLKVRNRIYRHVFDQSWVANVKPIAELETPDGKRWRIRQNFAIGRIDSNDLVLPDIKVSRMHALIKKQGQDQLYLVDLRSRNGTYLNENRVYDALLLRDRDRIDIGPYRLLFRQPNAPRRGDEDQSTQDKTLIDF